MSLLLNRNNNQFIIEFATYVFVLTLRHFDYIKFDQIFFVYEKFEKKKINDAIKTIMNNWIQKIFVKIFVDLQCLFDDQISENIHRATNAIEKNAFNATTNIIKTYCEFRFKKLKIKWQFLHEFVVNKRERSIVMIITFEFLNHKNDCFVNLTIEKNVCVDENVDVFISKIDEKLNIFVDLNFWSKESISSRLKSKKSSKINWIAKSNWIQYIRMLIIEMMIDSNNIDNIKIHSSRSWRIWNIIYSIFWFKTL